MPRSAGCGMRHQCNASVFKPWHVPFFFVSWLGGSSLFFYLYIGVLFSEDGWFPPIETLPLWFTIAIFFIGGIGIFIGAVVISSRLSKAQAVTLDEQGLDFERLGRIHFRDMASYDTNVHSCQNRLYLVVRPRGRMSLRLLSGERPQFPDFCRAFERQVAIEARRNAAVVNTPARENFIRRLLKMVYLGKAKTVVPQGVPVKRSFYGSPLARLIGFTGIVVLVVGLVAAWLVDPGLAFYAVWLVVIGGVPMLMLALGGRAE